MVRCHACCLQQSANESRPSKHLQRLPGKSASSKDIAARLLVIFQIANKAAIRACSHLYQGNTKREVSQQYCNAANTQTLAIMLSTSVGPLLAMQHIWHTSMRCHCRAAMPRLLQILAQEVQLERCAVDGYWTRQLCS